MSLGKAGPYELLELLGEGGVGQVYSARDPILGRQVAIKMLRPELSRNQEFLTRFLGEAQRLGDLNHANITTLYAFEVEAENPFMVMELVRGRTLKELLARTHRLPPREALAVLAQALAGLAYAHRSWVIHRDIKPSNLMVTDSGVVKIMDFGIARVRGSQHMTRAGQSFLTPLYGSPEQIKGEEVDERSDLYSLGVVFYEMLAGRPPFAAESDYALSLAHLQAPPPPLAEEVPGLDPAVEAALMKALAKKPEERFATAEEFGRAVGATAIRGEAADILQEFFAATFREETQETRKIEVPSGPRPTPSGARSQRARLPEIEATRVEPRRPQDAVRLPQRPQKGRAFPAILGAAAIALVIGFGYLGARSWDPAFSSRIAAIVEAGKPPAPLPTAKARQSASEKTASAPSPKPAPASPSALPPPPSPAPQAAPPASPMAASAEPPKPAPSPASPAAPSPSPQAPQSAPGEASKPTPPSFPAGPTPINPHAPPGPQIASIPPAPPAAPRPRGKPDIEGIVTGAMSASRIKVAAQFIDLDGIEDPTQPNPDLARHLKALIDLLAPAKGRVECYRKPSNKYRCYTDGKDLALLVLRQGIAQLGPDPPPEYREAAQGRKPASDRM